MAEEEQENNKETHRINKNQYQGVQKETIL